MVQVSRFISQFEKDGDALVGILRFTKDPPLELLRSIFGETGMMYEEHVITDAIAEQVAPLVDCDVRLTDFDYFLSCEAVR